MLVLATFLKVTVRPAPYAVVVRERLGRGFLAALAAAAAAVVVWCIVARQAGSSPPEFSIVVGAAVGLAVRVAARSARARGAVMAAVVTLVASLAGGALSESMLVAAQRSMPAIDYVAASPLSVLITLGEEATPLGIACLCAGIVIAALLARRAAPSNRRTGRPTAEGRPPATAT